MTPRDLRYDLLLDRAIRLQRRTRRLALGVGLAVLAAAVVAALLYFA